MNCAPEGRETLSKKEYWESVHGRARAEAPPPHVRAARRILGHSLAGMMGSYEDHLLWKTIYPASLPPGGGLKVIEIGSAPGRHLVRMSKERNADVWGLEYSPAGAARNRTVFEENGIDPDHVIEADLFDDGFAGRFAGSFDIVISRGFIEHFSDPSEAIERHLSLLKNGGTLVVSIPNMRGANYAQALVFNRGLIAIHNREIMDIGRFRALFPLGVLEPVFCGYYGTHKLTLFLHGTNRLTRAAKRVAEAMQAALNLLFRLLLRDRGLETSLFSPNILFIGRKIG